MEGNGGTVEYLVEDNIVVCAQVEDYGSENDTTMCSATSGSKSFYTEDNPEEPTAETVPSDFATQCQQELSRHLNTLKELLNEGEITTEWEDGYVVHLENVFNAGPETEVVEYTEVTIPRKVYDEFKN